MRTKAAIAAVTAGGDPREHGRTQLEGASGDIACLELGTGMHANADPV